MPVTDTRARKNENSDYAFVMDLDLVDKISSLFDEEDRETAARKVFAT